MMVTLAELEQAGKEIIEARQRRVEEAQRMAAEAEAKSKARMFEAVLEMLAEHTSADVEELRPLLVLDRQYVIGSFTAHLHIPGVRDDVALLRFDVVARVSDDFSTLDIQMARPEAPFYFAHCHPVPYYATLGEALYRARERQRRADEYARKTEEEDAEAAKQYEQRKAKKEQERNDRVMFIASLIDEYPIVEPLLRALATHLDREAELGDELDAALEF